METGWLIERQNGNGLALGLEECHAMKWTTPSRAIRFARKQDAEAYIATHLKPGHGAIAVEHEWR